MARRSKGPLRNQAIKNNKTGGSDGLVGELLKYGGKGIYGAFKLFIVIWCLIDTVHGYCSRWKLRANVSKSAIMVWSKASAIGEWKWGEHNNAT